MKNLFDEYRYEPHLFDSIKQLLTPGSTFYDIGAYDGITSIPPAQHLGGENVVIIEPGEMNWATIRARWEAHKLVPPRATFAGFLDSINKLGVNPQSVVYKNEFPPEAHKFRVAEQEEGLNFRVLEYRALYPEVAAIPSLTLDTVVSIAGPPAGIQMDVEGAELLVLQGAQYTLKEYHPVVWVSVHPKHMREHFGQEPSDLLNLMADLDYKSVLVADDHEQHWRFE